MESILPAGRYYVGDLCYVIRDQKWKDLCGYIRAGGKHNLTDVCIKTPEGMILYNLCTGGDGEYEDSKGRKYPVDTASIGCIEEKWIDKKLVECEEPCGHLIDFPEPFTCWIDETGSFHFGNEVFFDFSEE